MRIGPAQKVTLDLFQNLTGTIIWSRTSAINLTDAYFWGTHFLLQKLIFNCFKSFSKRIWSRLSLQIKPISLGVWHMILEKVFTQKNRNAIITFWEF